MQQNRQNLPREALASSDSSDKCWLRDSFTLTTKAFISEMNQYKNEKKKKSLFELWGKSLYKDKQIILLEIPLIIFH